VALLSKFALPRPRAGALRRGRLLDLLHNMGERRLYLVVAPPGAGKTTLLASFAGESDLPVHWCQLRTADADPAVLRDAIFTATGADAFDTLPEAILVLDDYQRIDHSAEANLLVDGLIEHAADGFKLIIAGSTIPKLQLSRLAAFNQAAGIGAEDLAFTDQEVRQLLRSTGTIANTEHHHLAGELYERQTPAVRHFLLAPCVLDDVEPAIAGQVTPTSRAAALLRRLEETNLFVTSLEGENAFRYHDLLRGVLREQMNTLGWQQAERHAGAAYRGLGRHDEAIPHLLAGTAYEDAAESILAAAEHASSRGYVKTLAGWLEALPDQIRLDCPPLAAWSDRIAATRSSSPRPTRPRIVSARRR
jgi:LuxR family maltose regulon positive regulatory protein